MEILKELLPLMPFWVWVVLTVGFVVVVLVVVRSSENLNFGKFSWKHKKSELDKETQKRLTCLETTVSLQADKIKQLEEQHHRDELEDRIKTEFNNLRDKCRDRRKRFSENIIEMYTQRYCDAITTICPNMEQKWVDLYIAYYSACIDGTTQEEVAPEMTRLVFENSFKDLPDHKTPRLLAEQMDSDFYEDVMGRCGYLLNISVKSLRLKWDAPFSRDVFEKDWMITLKNKALNEGAEYYRDVVEFRNLAMVTMWNEYQDVFHSYDSFKKYVEHRYKELY